MVLGGFIYFFQILMIIHAVKTGRNMYWVMILLMAPGIGGLAYLIVELLPDLMNNYKARRAVRGVAKTFNPGAGLRQRQIEHKLSGSVDAARHLASELMERGKYHEAIQHYEKALTGLYEFDPDLMLGLATAQFGNEQFAEARATLDLLMDRNSDFKSPEGHLLYAKAVEACGDDQKALGEYEVVARSYAGAEAQLRYGLLLERLGQNDAARTEFDDIINAAELAPRHYRKAQREWISEAKNGIKRLSE